MREIYVIGIAHTSLALRKVRLSSVPFQLEQHLTICVRPRCQRNTFWNSWRLESWISVFESIWNPSEMCFQLLLLTWNWSVTWKPDVGRLKNSWVIGEAKIYHPGLFLKETFIAIYMIHRNIWKCSEVFGTFLSITMNLKKAFTVLFANYFSPGKILACYENVQLQQNASRFHANSTLGFPFDSISHSRIYTILCWKIEESLYNPRDYSFRGIH